MNKIFLQASRKADKVRRDLSLNMTEPIDIYDASSKLGLSVRFVDISMEGLYLKASVNSSSSILLSSLRPIPRQVFNCAHELGHHIFEHGSQIDGLKDSTGYTVSQNIEETLVDSFAGAILMPPLGILSYCAKLNLTLTDAKAIDFFALSSYFGVGYHTLIYHCRINKLISWQKAELLLKDTPKKIFKNYISPVLPSAHFKVLKNPLDLKSVDIEVSNYILLDFDVDLNSDRLEVIKASKSSTLLRAIKPCLVEVYSKKSNSKFQIRVQRQGYIGLESNRYLETT